MSAINFPSDPIDGQIFETNGVKYYYNQSKNYWRAIKVDDINVNSLNLYKLYLMGT
jgi:hypothetical protein